MAPTERCDKSLVAARVHETRSISRCYYPSSQDRAEGDPVAGIRHASKTLHQPSQPPPSFLCSTITTCAISRVICFYKAQLLYGSVCHHFFSCVCGPNVGYTRRLHQHTPSFRRIAPGLGPDTGVYAGITSDSAVIRQRTVLYHEHPRSSERGSHGTRNQD